MLSIGLLPLFWCFVFKLHLPSEFFFQKRLPLKIFSSVGNFFEVLLTSSVRLLLFSAFPLCNHKIFFSGFFSSSFYFFIPAASALPILVELFLSLTFFLLYFFDSDVRYIRFLFYSRRSNLTVLWSVPPFLKL